ncbi:MAG TPA: hypothetical protein VFD51_00310 [Patescibacteria group bacterium]|nr:hypothetical protein [Patescibacteria group bacterium]
MLSIKKGNLPSNIETGWRQMYFHNLERDNVLDCFVDIFVKCSNSWVISKKLFDQEVDKKTLRHWYFFKALYGELLEVDGDSIHLSQHVADYLLLHNWKFSIRSVFKIYIMGILKSFVMIFSDAWAYIFDPEAKMDSGFKYSHGGPISVRSAKKDGLMK